MIERNEGMEKDYYWKEWTAHAAAPNTHNRVLELVQELVPSMQGKAALDVPSGAGAFSKVLSDFGFNVSSLDIHRFEDFLHNPACLTVADLNNGLPYGDGMFDLLISIEGIEHLENPSMFLREAARVLKKDGLIILTTPNVDSYRSRRKYFLDGFYTFFNPESPTTRTSGHLHPIDMVFFRGAAARAGLEIKEITVNRIPDKPLGRFLKNMIRPMLTKKLPATMHGDIPFFGDVIIYALKKAEG